MQLKKTICVTLIASLLSACASVPSTPRQFSEKAITSEKAAVTEMTAAWNDIPVKREGKAMIVLVTPFSVPQDIRTKPIKLELEPGATVKDLVAVMANLGYSILLADKEAGAKEFYMPRFNGTVGNLLNTVSKATDVWFTWDNGTIVVASSEKVVVTLPQEESLATKVAEGLKSLGIDGATSSWEAGMATLTVTPRQLANVRAYLNRMTANAALVSLQVAIINVQLNQTANQGVDWTKLQLAVGRNYAPSGIQSMDGFKPVNNNSAFASPSGSSTGTTTSSSTTTGTTGTTGSTSASSDSANQALAAVGLASGGLKGLITNSAFSFTGLYDFLEAYGTTDTKQNVVLKSVTGTSVELKSLTQTPYVESIAVTSTGGNNSNGTANTMGSAKTAKANDGLTLKMVPLFDAAANTITVKLDLTLEAVLAFNNLSAGNQIGQLTQPTTAERSFNDVLRLRPGQTVVVGGITYDSIGKNGNAPTGLSPLASFQHTSLSVTRNSLFIVVRPTVTSLGQVTEEEYPDLFGNAKLEAVAPPTKKTKMDEPSDGSLKQEPKDTSAKKISSKAKANLAKDHANKPMIGKPSHKEELDLNSSPVKPGVHPAAKGEATPATYDAEGYTTIPLRTKE